MSVTQNAKPAAQKQPAMAALVSAVKTGTLLQHNSRLCGTVVSNFRLLFYHPAVKEAQQKTAGNNRLLLYYLLVNKLKCWLFAATADLFSARCNGDNNYKSFVMLLCIHFVKRIRNLFVLFFVHFHPG